MPPTAGQNLDFLFFFFFYLHYIGDISKVVLKKTLSYNTPTKLNAIMFAKHTLAVMHTFHTAEACYKCARFWHSFLMNNFADFLYSAGKKLKISSSCRWRFELATSATDPLFNQSVMLWLWLPFWWQQDICTSHAKTIWMYNYSPPCVTVE